MIPQTFCKISIICLYTYVRHVSETVKNTSVYRQYGVGIILNYEMILELVVGDTIPWKLSCYNWESFLHRKSHARANSERYFGGDGEFQSSNCPFFLLSHPYRYKCLNAIFYIMSPYLRGKVSPSTLDPSLLLYLKAFSSCLPITNYNNFFNRFLFFFVPKGKSYYLFFFASFPFYRL